MSFFYLFRFDDIRINGGVIRRRRRPCHFHIAQCLDHITFAAGDVYGIGFAGKYVFAFAKRGKIKTGAADGTLSAKNYKRHFVRGTVAVEFFTFFQIDNAEFRQFQVAIAQAGYFCKAFDGLIVFQIFHC